MTMEQAPTTPAPPRAGAGAYLTVVLQGAAVIAPLVSIYAALFVAPLLVIATVAIILLAVWERRRIPLMGRPVLVMLGLLVVWGAVSSLWSPYPAGSITTALQLLSLFACGAVVIGATALLDAGGAARIGRALALGIALALVVYTIEMALDSPIQALLRERGTGLEQVYSPFNRGLAVLVLLLPSAAIALRRRGALWLAVFLTAATGAIVYAYYGSAVAVALACGLIAGLLSYAGGRSVTRLMGGLAAALVLTAPVVATHVITPATIERVEQQVDNLSVPHRLVIWQFVSERVLERPLKGWGLDAARSFPGGNSTAPIHTRSCQPPCSVEVERLPLHPHNMALQWWLELGLPGAAIGAAVLFWLFHQITRVAGDRLEQGVLVAQMTAAGIVSGLSYGAWQSWWLATMIMALAFSRVAVRSRAQQNPNIGIAP